MRITYQIPSQFYSARRRSGLTTCTHVYLKQDTPLSTSHSEVRNAHGHACERAFTEVEREIGIDFIDFEKQNRVITISC